MRLKRKGTKIEVSKCWSQFSVRAQSIINQSCKPAINFCAVKEKTDISVRSDKKIVIWGQVMNCFYEEIYCPTMVLFPDSRHKPSKQNKFQTE